MIEIFVNKSSELAFRLNIEGTSVEPKVRFVVEREEFDIGFMGIVSDKKAIVQIPRLKDFSILGEGEYSAHLEVVITDNFFVPWEDSIKIINPVEVNVEFEGSMENEVETFTEEVVETPQEETSVISVSSEPIVEENSEEEEVVEEEPLSEEDEIDEYIEDLEAEASQETEEEDEYSPEDDEEEEEPSVEETLETMAAEEFEEDIFDSFLNFKGSIREFLK